MFTASACSASGTCVAATPAPCAGNLGCNAAGDACLTTCTALADCVSGFYCSAGSCVAQEATGACSTNDACTSGICGVSGVGHCCTGTTPCSTADPQCGALDCDAAGACVYAGASTSCGPASPICTVANDWFGPGACDGMGNCAGTTAACTPYLCVADPTGCPTTCTQSTNCITSAFCDSMTQACCANIPAGATLSVDSVTGSDATCCGYSGNGPCETLTRAMALIAISQAQNVTVTATINGDGGDWAPDSGEVYPIVLGWGVEISAPGVFFLDGDGGTNAMLFDVQKATGDSLGYASMVGLAASPINVGINAANTVVTFDSEAIAVEQGATLYLANAAINAGSNFDGNSSTIQVGAGGTLWLGQDQSATNTGTVYIGNDLGNPATYGNMGINCLSDGMGSGGTINDATLAGQSSVVIQGTGIDLYLNDSCTASLTSAPKFGFADCLAGTFSGVCGGIVDGNAKLTFSNGTVQCMGFCGLGTSSNTPGNPTIVIDNSLIEDTFQGVSASAGKVTVTNSTMTGNWYGAAQYAGTLDLSGGGNTVICSSNRLFGGPAVYGPGIDVYNSATTNLAADNVTWDTPGPDYFSCDDIFESCTCNIATCTDTPGANGMSAVEDSTALGGITTTNNGYTDAGCN